MALFCRIRWLRHFGIFRLDGSYALHEDGDDIPDIAPVAVIPEKYYEE